MIASGNERASTHALQPQSSWLSPEQSSRSSWLENPWISMSYSVLQRFQEFSDEGTGGRSALIRASCLDR